jgi:hypoxanthine phosphoribosyltransferase
MAQDIARDYAGREPHLVCVLKGACTFMTDLSRAIDLNLTLDYIAVSSYGAATKSSGEVKLVKDLDQGLEGRDLLVVEDIVDTGLTLNYLLNVLRARGPRTLKVALLSKPSRRLVGYPSTASGSSRTIRRGYGLDYNEKYRNARHRGLRQLRQATGQGKPHVEHGAGEATRRAGGRWVAAGIVTGEIWGSRTPTAMVCECPP